MAILTKIFEDVLSKENTYQSKDLSFKIKPSVLSSPCMRKIYYSTARIPEDFPFPLSSKKRMKLGEAIHNMLHDVYTEAGVIVDYYNEDGSIPIDHVGKPNVEFPVSSPDLFIKKGKVDAVYIINNKLWLGEYKSINLKGFLDLTGPKSDHMIQGVTYLYVFNKLLAEGAFKHIKKLEGFTKAEGVIFLYINKDDTSMKEFSITTADDFFVSIVNKIFKVKENFDKKELPPKTPDYCQSCNWRVKCKNNFNI